MGLSKVIMDIRSLACFIAVADELHFRRAADKLNMTQPSLSQRIRTLETEIGTPLLLRDRRHVALTPAGQAFLEPARRAVSNASVAKERARRASRGELGRLRLGFTVIAFYGVLPKVVRRFRARFPDVEVDLREMNSPLLEGALASDEIDLAILHPPLENSGLGVHPLRPLSLVLALPEAHPLAALSRINVVDLAGEPFLIAPRAIGPDFYDRVIALFQQAGANLRVVQEVSPMTTLTGLVAAGAGMGFVTEDIARVGRPGVAFRPVMPEAPSIPTAAAWRGAEVSPTSAHFLEIVDELWDA